MSSSLRFSVWGQGRKKLNKRSHLLFYTNDFGLQCRENLFSRALKLTHENSLNDGRENSLSSAAFLSMSWAVLPL